MASVMSDGGLPLGKSAPKDDMKDTDKDLGTEETDTEASKNPAEIVEIIDEDDEDMIDEEQLEEYQEMVDQLGGFPVSSTVH